MTLKGKLILHNKIDYKHCIFIVSRYAYLSFTADDLPLGRATFSYKYSNKITHLSFKMYFNPLDTIGVHISIMHGQIKGTVWGIYAYALELSTTLSAVVTTGGMAESGYD